MRTTVEITDIQRARLLEIAARRGEKGFSRLVQEAIDLFLAEHEDRERGERTAAALDVLGTLDETAAAEMTETMRTSRAGWR